MSHDLTKPPTDPRLRDSWIAARDAQLAEQVKTDLPEVIAALEEAHKWREEHLTTPENIEVPAEAKVKKNNTKKIEKHLKKIECPDLVQEEYQAPCCKLIRMRCKRTGDITNRRKCQLCQKEKPV